MTPIIVAISLFYWLVFLPVLVLGPIEYLLVLRDWANAD
jgi:hypothetical protein